MKYSKGYKYQLKETVRLQTNIAPLDPCVVQGFIYLDPDGTLIIYHGYAWDGCSAAPDLKGAMFASLVHDALYQLIKEGLLDIAWKHVADELFYDLMIQYGTPVILAKLYRLGVVEFGGLFLTKPREIYLTEPVDRRERHEYIP